MVLTWLPLSSRNLTVWLRNDAETEHFGPTVCNLLMERFLGDTRADPRRMSLVSFLNSGLTWDMRVRYAQFRCIDGIGDRFHGTFEFCGLRCHTVGI